jgi:uncharacterized FAD-dependent dehydrogenase
MPRYLLTNLSVPVDTDWRRELPRQVNRALHGKSVEPSRLKVVRRSIDARHRPAHYVYSVEIELEETLSKLPVQCVLAEDRAPLRVEPGKRTLGCPPVIVGAGPAGLFAAFLLAQHGYAPHVLERGGDVAARQASLARLAKIREPDPECNALFGLGGAGTFSDGKLVTGIRHTWLPEVLRVLVECGAPPDILVDAKPHVGTDILSVVVENLQKRIRDSGGKVETGVRVDDLLPGSQGHWHLRTTAGSVDAGIVVLASGHSARDTWQMLSRRGFLLEPKPFQMGIRAEHPQAFIDETRYGPGVSKILGAADYKLVGRSGDVPVFSFCMCPGGETMPTVNEPGHLCINGMSLHARASAFSSSALVATLQPRQYGGDNLENCLGFQRRVERAAFCAGGEDYSAPAQRLRDFAQGMESTTLPASSYRLGIRPARLDELLPPFLSNPLRHALDQFEKKMPGYLQDDALALGVESRASSPVRIVRDNATLEARGVPGVYPVGEGAGYAGGIMSAALDGLNAAARIIETYRPIAG